MDNSKLERNYHHCRNALSTGSNSNPESHRLTVTHIKCGSADAWLPRAPGINEDDLENWRCVKCKPCPNPAIIAKQRGPLWEASELERETIDRLIAEVASQSIVVALERPTCAVCGCQWVIEQPGYAGVDRFCWSCHAPIDAGVFEFAATTRRAWQGKKLRNLKASEKRTDAKNGSGEKLAGRR